MKQEGKAATKIIEKLRWLREAIKYSQTTLSEDSQAQQVYIRAQKAIDHLSLWLRSMAKPIKLQHQKHTQKMASKLPYIEEPHELIKGKKMRKKIEECIKHLKISYNENDAKLLTAYCASQIIYQNSQWPGVIENVTLREYADKCFNEEGKLVINCKTGSQGAAQLVIDKTTDHLLEKYHKLVREKIESSEGCQHLMFLTTTGKRYTQVYQKIKQQIQRYNIDFPTPSEYRIVVSTEASEMLPEQDYRALAKHMGHSMETSRRFYEIARLDSAVKVHKTITQMAKIRRWPKDDDTLKKMWPLSKASPLI